MKIYSPCVRSLVNQHRRDFQTEARKFCNSICRICCFCRVKLAPCSSNTTHTTVKYLGFPYCCICCFCRVKLAPCSANTTHTTVKYLGFPYCCICRICCFCRVKLAPCSANTTHTTVKYLGFPYCCICRICCFCCCNSSRTKCIPGHIFAVSVV